MNKKSGYCLKKGNAEHANRLSTYPCDSNKDSYWTYYESGELIFTVGDMYYCVMANADACACPHLHECAHTQNNLWSFG